ncbi:hypothetical protein Tco_0368299 [Tanacetum coccineum]
MNGEVQLQALVDGKKIIITKASVRRDLQLNDEEGLGRWSHALRNQWIQLLKTSLGKGMSLKLFMIIDPKIETGVKKLEKKGGQRTHSSKDYTSWYDTARNNFFDEASFVNFSNDLVGDEVVVESEVVVKNVVEENNYAAATTFTMIDADYQMAQQMQAEEQEKLSIEEKSKLFVQLLEARKKHYAVMRIKEKRNKPPTKAQKRNTMSTYLKNMAGYKSNQLKNKSSKDIQKLFNKAMKRVNTFVDMDTELVKGSKVRAKGSKTIAEESSKKGPPDGIE